MSKLKVRDLMTAYVIPLRPKDGLSAVSRTMDELGVRHVPVVDDEGDLVGLVSQRDLIRRALADPVLTLDQHLDMLRACKVQDVMTVEVETVEPDQDLRPAAQLMFENKYGCLPVVEGRKLVGILTEGDFVRWFTRGK